MKNGVLFWDAEILATTVGLILLVCLGLAVLSRMRSGTGRVH
jgi:hypothetical protein